ncbi:Alpha/Beta hydrolase protein [Plectosphaerella plurivora]|uniref:Alpha/Beta hydrolase protein n=1 Tax=Plectosphaerella plurivora TaxID=936078 RepID=A0A9P8V9N7_9PEZI|nr:Alpha/Beta hydrolase protein [Plectosphaerella plurivora]
MGNTISYQDKPFTLSLGTKGSIRGLQRDNKSRRYAGRKPKPLPPGFSYDSPNGELYDTTRFRSIYPQKAFHVGKAEGGDGDYSEDCLFVNIWTPVPKANDDRNTKWPVMLWLHGGCHEPGIDLTELISIGGLDAIIVAIGYRLNVFRFLAGEELLRDSGSEAGENIPLFGGDPDNITLAGRSFTELYEYFGINSSSLVSEKLANLRVKTVRELIEAIKHLKYYTFRPVTDDLFIHAGMIGYLQSSAFTDDFKSRGYRLLINEYNSPDEPTVSNYYAPDLPESGDDVRAPSRALVHHLARNGVSVAYRLSFIDETVAPARFGVAYAINKPF